MKVGTRSKGKGGSNQIVHMSMCRKILNCSWRAGSGEICRRLCYHFKKADDAMFYNDVL